MFSLFRARRVNKSKTGYREINNLLKMVPALIKDKPVFDGVFMYNGEYFSREFFEYCKSNNVIKFNENYIENEKKAIELESKGIDTLPWYYKNCGKLFEDDFLKNEKGISIKNVMKKAPKTTELLIPHKNKAAPNKPISFVFADWYGPYFLSLMALAGDEYHEVTLKTSQLINFGKQLQELEPKGMIISFVNWDFNEIKYSNIDLFSLPIYLCPSNIRYFKFLRAIKSFPSSTPQQKAVEFEKKLEQYVEWVIAYSL